MNKTREEEADSDSDESVWDDLCDVDVLYSACGDRDNIVREWNFVRRSEENKYLDQSVLDRTEFSLEYNSVDKWLLEQSLIEIKHVLQTSRIKLFESNNNQNISIVQSFLAALPYQFLNIFSKWLKAGSKTGTPNPTQPLITLGSICVFCVVNVK